MTKTITVNIDDLKLDWFIGIFDHEYETAQPVIINIKLKVTAPTFDDTEDYDDVVCYKTIVDKIKELQACGHVRLVETLANKICDLCLADKRVLKATVDISKPNAIDEAGGVGVKLSKENKG